MVVTAILFFLWKSPCYINLQSPGSLKWAYSTDPSFSVHWQWVRPHLQWLKVPASVAQAAQKQYHQALVQPPKLHPTHLYSEEFVRRRIPVLSRRISQSSSSPSPSPSSSSSSSSLSLSSSSSSSSSSSVGVVEIVFVAKLVQLH